MSCAHSNETFVSVSLSELGHDKVIGVAGNEIVRNPEKREIINSQELKISTFL